MRLLVGIDNRQLHRLTAELTQHFYQAGDSGTTVAMPAGSGQQAHRFDPAVRTIELELVTSDRAVISTDKTAAQSSVRQQAPCVIGIDGCPATKFLISSRLCFPVVCAPKSSSTPPAAMCPFMSQSF